MNRSGPPRRDPVKVAEWHAKSRGPKNSRAAKIRPQSSKKRADRAIRADLVGRLVAAGVRCEVCPELARAGVRTHCSGAIGGIHERRKRSSSGSTRNAENLIPCCNWSNATWIELHDDAARSLFGTWLVVRDGDPEWDRLAARLDRFDDPPEVTLRACDQCGAAFVTVPPSGILTCGHLLPSRRPAR